MFWFFPNIFSTVTSLYRDTTAITCRMIISDYNHGHNIHTLYDLSRFTYKQKQVFYRLASRICMIFLEKCIFSSCLVFRRDVYHPTAAGGDYSLLWLWRDHVQGAIVDPGPGHRLGLWPTLSRIHTLAATTHHRTPFTFKQHLRRSDTKSFNFCIYQSVWWGGGGLYCRVGMVA